LSQEDDTAVTKHFIVHSLLAAQAEDQVTKPRTPKNSVYSVVAQVRFFSFEASTDSRSNKNEPVFVRFHLYLLVPSPRSYVEYSGRSTCA
jgi:hypothetical protein